MAVCKLRAAWAHLGPASFVAACKSPSAGVKPASLPANPPLDQKRQPAIFAFDRASSVPPARMTHCSFCPGCPRFKECPPARFPAFVVACALEPTPCAAAVFPLKHRLSGRRQRDGQLLGCGQLRGAYSAALARTGTMQRPCRQRCSKQVSLASPTLPMRTPLPRISPPSLQSKAKASGMNCKSPTQSTVPQWHAYAGRST